jgi:hypothetical protein
VTVKLVDYVTGSAVALPAIAAIAIAALTLYLLVRMRRGAAARRLVLIEVGEPSLSLARTGGLRSLSPLTLALILVAAAGLSVLAAKALVLPTLLGAPALVVLATALLAFFLLHRRRPRRLYLIAVNVARVRGADRYLQFTPPGDDESQERLATELAREVSRLNPRTVMVSIPRHSAWWTGAGLALHRLAELCGTGLTTTAPNEPAGLLAPACFALLAWDPRVRDARSEDAFVEALVAAGYVTVFIDPSHQSSMAAFHTLLDVLAEGGESLHQVAEGKALIPVCGGLLWRGEGRGPAALPIVCCPEALRQRLEDYTIAVFGKRPQFVDAAATLVALACDLDALYPGVPAPLAAAHGLQLDVQRVGGGV